MRVAVINGRGIDTMEGAHWCLHKSLQLPDYYGKNLDALYDLLSTEDRLTLILLFDSRKLIERLGDKGRKLLEVFHDVSLANRQIRFVCIERSPRQHHRIMKDGKGTGLLFHGDMVQ